MHHEYLVVLEIPNEFLSNISRCIEKWPSWERSTNIWDEMKWLSFTLH